jgi:hypothetical protein
MGRSSLPHQGQLTACKSNLKNIGTGMEMYSTDNGAQAANYPQYTSMQGLVAQ